MILTKMLLVLTGIICTETRRTVYVDSRMSLCGVSDKQFTFQVDGEEVAHANFTIQKFITTLPVFAGEINFPSNMYDFADEQQQFCKQNMDVAIKAYDYPAVAKVSPRVLLYPKDDVIIGTENTLICLVTGFHPPRLNVRWTKNYMNVNLKVNASQLRVNVNSFTYNQFFSVKFTPQKGDIYRCIVEHSALQQPIKKEFDVKIFEMRSIGPSVFCGVGLALGLLGVATGIFFFIRRKH